MATIKINVKKFCDEHAVGLINKAPEPFKSAGLTAYAAFMRVVGGLLDDDIEFDLPDLPGAPGLPAPPQVKPIDPAAALNDIAKAIKQAETTLLGENLSIRNASVDVELTVAVAGAAGASAKFNLQIGPTPAD